MSLLQVGRLTNMVSLIGKSVRKYAEVGISRFTAMPAHVTDEEFAQYTQLTCSVCQNCQVTQFHSIPLLF